MSGRQKRKRRRARERGDGAMPRAAPPAPAPAAPKRSKDDVARERLVPLREDERPRAVTIAAAIAAALAVSNVVLYAIGIDTGDAEPTAAGTFLFAGLMVVMAVGMWKSRYWAVLGFQALLALLIIVMSLLLLTAEDLLGAALALAILAGAGTLFWFLVKSLARIQLPERRPPSASG